MTDQAFLNQLVGRTIKEIDVQNQSIIVVHFTDGSAVAVHADTKDSTMAIQQGYGEYTPILRYEEKAEPTAIQLKGIA